MKIFLTFLLFIGSCAFLFSEDIDADRFREIMADKDSVIIDVRTKSEFDSGHIKNAINIDFYNSSFQDELLKLDKNKRYLVYCRGGGRSGESVKFLQKNGYKNVYNLIGGVSSKENRSALDMVK